MSSDTSCGDWNPRQQREAPKFPGAGPDPRLLPMKDHLETPLMAPSWPLPSLYTRHLACHQQSVGPEQTPRRQAKPFHYSSSTPLHYSPPPPGHCQAQSSTQRFDAHGDPTHPAAFVQRKDRKQSGMCWERHAEVKEPGPGAGESWIPGSAPLLHRCPRWTITSHISVIPPH